MDMAFLRRSARMLAERDAAPLDHSVLLAALAARSAVESAAVDMPPPADWPGSEADALAEIILDGGDRRRAARIQRGSFSRAEAGRRVNGL
jgi:hypothetical protein